MIKLSYSSLTNLSNGHEWLNKQMGIEVPEYSFLQEGRDAHRVIQDHVSGKKKHPDLAHIKTVFPIVEEKDFDERCKFSFKVEMVKGMYKPLDKYEIRGFYDGRLKNFSETMEGKFSSTPWSIGKFKKDIQRKIYALSNDKIKTQHIITGPRDMSKWKVTPPTISDLKPDKKDKEDARKWIIEGIELLEGGVFTKGLDLDQENARGVLGRCTDCFWNMPRYRDIASCHFI